MSRTRTYQRISVPITITIALAGVVLALASTSGPGRGAGAAPPGRAPAVTLAAVTAQRTSHGRPALRAPRRIARAMLVRRFGWKAWQFKYLDRIWAIESGWNRYATNPYSGAYGIPQAVPGSKMSTAGPGWRWNARTQIRWGMRYIKSRYRSPYRAWRHQHIYGWY